MAFTSLNHYPRRRVVEYSYECTRKDGAVGGRWSDGAGVCGQFGAEPAKFCLDRLKSGRYRALLFRRHYIDKSDGSKRALGNPVFRGKGGATGDCVAAGADLRAGLSGLLVLASAPVAMRIKRC